MSLSDPVNLMLESLLPSPALKERPVVPLRVSRPLVAVRVTSSVSAPASTSLMLIRLPLAVWNTRLTF
ncbi:hypothetical protein D9M68_257450 [compost metagenome]